MFEPIYPKKILPKILPTIHSRTKLNKTDNFNIEQQQIEFTNGESRVYEKIPAGKKGSVLIVGVNDEEDFILIREYCGGKECYELAFPKGKVEENEKLEDAACRELQEETGYRSDNIRFLKTISIAPNYMEHQTHLFLAQDIYWYPKTGDEPEPVECYFWSINKIEELLLREDFTEARSIAAFYLAKALLLRK